MVNQVTANPGASGPEFATDVDGSGYNWPYSKVAYGGDGVQTQVTAATALPVQPGTATVWNIQGGNSTAVKVDGSAVTQPISGTVTVTDSVPLQIYGVVSATSLPLPSGAATSANQSTEITALNQLHTDLIAALPTGSNVIGGVTQSGTWNITNLSGTVSLPTGAATAANQATEITSLAQLHTDLIAATPTGSNTIGAVTAPGAAALALDATVSTMSAKIPALGQAVMASSQPVTIASNQSAVPVVGASASGAAVSGNPVLIAGSDGTNARTLSTALVPAARGTYGAVTTPAQQLSFRPIFSSAISNNVDTNYFNLIATGSGQTVNQTGGNLVLTTGTTTNSETIIRSLVPYTGTMIARFQPLLSQRIVNNNFIFELVDLIGDSLAVTVNSATSITVVIPGTTFTSANVGQYVNVQNISSISGAIPGRYAIASVSGTSVTFTVAGYPGSGTGTCSLTGWNYIQLNFNGTVATQVQFDTQARGYNSGAYTNTVSSSASGTNGISILSIVDNTVNLSNNTPLSYLNYTVGSAAKYTNIPDVTVPLYLQIRALNGSTAPASTTTATIGLVSVENYSLQQVTVNDIKPQSGDTILSMSVSSGALSSCQQTVLSSAATTAQDAFSAAITTTTTSATITPVGGNAFMINIQVTAVSGTTPTLDVEVQESYDTGTNWVAIYDFPRITATGSYTSPPIVSSGSRIRYVQTVAGTTPSFTRMITRGLMSQDCAVLRQEIDRTVSLTTLSSVTGSLNAQAAAKNVQLIINIGATTIAPALQLQTSDDYGASWISIGSPLTAVANSTVQVTINNVTALLYRAIVTTAGTGTTAGYVLMRSF